jgi:hypothetical protein
VFTDDTQFENVTFGQAEFDWAKFNGDVEFRDVEFSDRATFRWVEFGGSVDFTEVEFGGDARFAGAEFGQDARFNCLFRGAANFGKDDRSKTGAIFKGKADFYGVRFEGDALFEGKRMLGQLSASREAPKAERDRALNFLPGSAQFHGETSFQKATFCGHALFRSITFSGIARFGQARFEGAARFDDSEFNGDVTFVAARFHKRAGFARANFKRAVNLAETVFLGVADFSSAVLRDETTLGPCKANDLKVSGIQVGRRCAIECDAQQFSGADIHCPDGLNLRLDGGIYIDASDMLSVATLTFTYEGGQLTLADAKFNSPTTIAAPAHPKDSADVPASVEPLTVPKMLTLRRVDATNLNLVGIDLRACRFLDCYNRDRLRIDGPLQFAPTPAGRRWTRRQVLADEHLWRARYDRRPAGWFPDDSRHPGEEIPPYRPEERMRPPARAEAARVQTAYRDLRKGREDAKDEPGAADFYYGEMEMRRLAAHPHSIERALLNVYWTIAGYGLRASRAVVALFLLLLLGTIGLATVGFGPSSRLEYRPAAQNPTGQAATYRQVAVPGSRPGWAAALDYSLESATSLLRTYQPRPLSAAGQVIEITLRMLGPVFLALAILAIRGRVKR